MWDTCIEKIDVLASQCDQSLEACRSFCGAAEHLFRDMALFHAR
jgi:hypothetical protein